MTESWLESNFKFEKNRTDEPSITQIRRIQKDTVEKMTKGLVEAKLDAPCVMQWKGKFFKICAVPISEDEFKTYSSKIVADGGSELDDA